MADHVYLFFVKCGCLRGLCNDDPSLAGDIASMTRRYIKGGGRVERVEFGDYRDGKHGRLTRECPHKPQTGNLFATKESGNG